ncbi:MAG: DUF1800 domain-containing protein [Acidobacteriota bacterium]|nr:DUF1800 domain-containing protein [Acidobacteriota bacterium]
MKRNFSLFYRFTALVLLLALGSPIFATGGAADTKDKRRALSEEQKILHVLNRLGYGARPGDVEKVKAVGLQKYIEQQLNPAAINDAAVEAKLKRFEILDMTTADIFAKYPNGNALLRMLQGGRRNAQQQQRNQAQTNQMPNADQQQQQPETEIAATQRRERQEKLRALYEQYNLRPANQIMQQQISARVLRGVYSERQLQEVMVDFWANHFNVYSGKAAVRWYIPSYERDVIRKNALGSFKDLLVGTAQHPAMLFYLDNFQSVSPNAANNNRGGGGVLQRAVQNGGLNERQRERLRARGLSDAEIDRRFERVKQMMNNRRQRGINENYARELMELHTLGVDGGYTQKDIVEVAKAFTGWTIADPRGYRRAAADMISDRENNALDRLQRMAGVPEDIESGEFYFNENWHEKGEKTVLGQKVNEGGIKDGLKVIDILVKHPSTAKFIARKLAVKFVSDKPSEALVNRVAQAFQKSEGDVKTTLRALFTDAEFFAPENYRAKIKTPFELAISAIRAIGADTNSSPALLALINKMGEIPYGYQAPTGYPDTAEDWVNTGALLERMNFAVALASNRIPQTRVDLKKFEAKTKPEILDKAIAEVLKGEVSPATRTTLLKQLEKPLPEAKTVEIKDETMADDSMIAGGQGRRGAGGQARLLPPSGNVDVFKVVGLILGSPEFQRQ